MINFRLVYAGKLLENTAILNDVLRLDDARDVNDAFTVHLVCRITTPPPQVPSSKSSNMVNSSNTTSTSPSENHLRRRPVGNNNENNSTNQIPASSTNVITNPWVGTLPANYSQSQYQDQVSTYLNIEWLMLAKILPNFA